MRRVVWTIAGSDSGGAAGLQADIQTLAALGVHPATIVTAVTAQNSRRVGAIFPVNAEQFEAQWDLLAEDLEPSAIKIGMIAARNIAESLVRKLPTVRCPVVLDPVLAASSGDPLCEADLIGLLKDRLIPAASLITPNIDEAAFLTGIEIRDENGVERAMRSLLAMGAKAVLIKGGHFSPRASYCVDRFSDGRSDLRLASPMLDRRGHGTGCTLSSATAAHVARGESLLDALVGAKAFTTSALRQGLALGKGLPTLNWREAQDSIGPNDFPHLVPDLPVAFPRLKRPLGFYPIVDSNDWLLRLAELGVKTAQLRIKERSPNIAREILRATEIGRRFDLQLFINDHWREAIDFGAYGIHLGQEDLLSADLAAIAKAGLRLGISTHSLSEMARAKGLQPSYVAVGPIFPTTLKAMRFAPQGVERLTRWRRYFDIPVVAIGGISWEKAREVLASGVDSIAVVSDITQSPDPSRRVGSWLELFQ